MVTVAEAMAVAVAGDDLCKCGYIILFPELIPSGLECNAGAPGRALELIFTETGSVDVCNNPGSFCATTGEILLMPVLRSQLFGEFLLLSDLIGTVVGVLAPFFPILGEECVPLSSFDRESSSVIILSKEPALPMLLAPLLLLLKLVLLFVALGVLLLFPRFDPISGSSSWDAHMPAVGISHP